MVAFTNTTKCPITQMIRLHGAEDHLEDRTEMTITGVRRLRVRVTQVEEEAAAAATAAGRVSGHLNLEVVGMMTQTMNITGHRPENLRPDATKTNLRCLKRLVERSVTKR